ncbi:cytochrome b-245 heavy chain-like isoform X2 [Dendronephthya gigantea]|uniref:cytochrome b-245 heavy chain-like isoform X2 n=1 Tax=Dendronephthya gigantea TaxID=151771 RepID=UPI00106A280C|nr:cytochrome b-245 heavy chain-like isoform X2 [Dendronephthya gigantea]
MNPSDRAKWVLLAIWIGINALLFGVTFEKYNSSKEYYYLRVLTKSGLPWARASATVINFNCLLILLPVCRNMLSFLRGLDCCGMGQNLQRLLDKNLKFHKVIAYAICLFTAIHIGAHVFNFENLVRAYDGTNLEHSLSILGDSGDKTYINPVRKQNSDPPTEVFRTVAGVSGFIITIMLILMVTSSTELLRRSYFEVFWYTHHLFVIFFVGLIVHGMQGLVRRQTNTDEHDPERCKGDINKCRRLPHFESSGPQTWKWIVLPLSLYFIERCIRFVRSMQNVAITKVVKHPSNVIEIKMKKPGFNYSAGQYVFLQCPKISRLEWHPFTLTSSPEEETFSVHIRTVGDWTTSFSKACVGEGIVVNDLNNAPSISVDGPFGTSSSGYFKYTTCVFIGAGIGVTPFASILKSIWHRHEHSCPSLQIQKIYFYWICPDTNAFEWFAQLLESLESQMAEKGNHGFLSYNIYLTRGWSKEEARNIMVRDERQSVDVITGLRQKTHFGRPEWTNIFKTIANDNPRSVRSGLS